MQTSLFLEKYPLIFFKHIESNSFESLSHKTHGGLEYLLQYLQKRISLSFSMSIT